MMDAVLSSGETDMKRFDVVCIGMAIMDSIVRGFDPEPISSAGFRAESGSLNVGGDAVNEAVALAKLGMRTSLLCSLGNDPAGNVILDALAAGKVDTSAVLRSDVNPTPITTIFVSSDGNRKSITNKAHSYNFHPEQHKELFTDAKAIIMGSLFRAPFNDPDVIREVVSAAKEKDMLVFADTKLPNFRKLTLDDIADSLPMIDYITPNEDEGRYYTGREDPEEIAAVFLEKGANNVIVKLGRRGCYFGNRESSLYVPAYDIEAVDATGAGDNFIAGFVSEIISGSSPEDALVFANACGGICSTAVGAGTALRNRQQVLDFIKQI